MLRQIVGQLPTSSSRPTIPVALLHSNSVELSFSDDGETYNGHGPGIYNLGGSSTILFKRLAIFKDNVGGFVSMRGLKWKLQMQGGRDFHNRLISQVP